MAIASVDVCDTVQRAANEDLLGPILTIAKSTRFALLGEATHGTHEFYALRVEITKRLIEEHGFVAVAAEADWPDAYRVNRYVRGESNDRTADEALGDFRRFPQWMWRNTVVVEFVEWLRSFNQGRPTTRQVGFYGLDLYSLHTSIAAVLAHLARVDPEAGRRARERYGCFDHFGTDPQRYGLMTTHYGVESCEDEVVAQLAELIGRNGSEDSFAAAQNARLVANAEAYYRAMFRGRDESWNLRDRHMAETLDALAHHLAGDGVDPRVAVWAHNSHLGDARATEMGRRGELNLGQLVRETHGDEAALIGFTTFDGTVTAASDWGEPAQRKLVRPGLPESYEALFHEADLPEFSLTLRDADALRQPRLERAIGVIYRPETERVSHYFHARLPDQFDAVIHVDRTTALQPL